jgi:4a-hydroxytetrahydrobiopterin dehydratase
MPQTSTSKSPPVKLAHDALALELSKLREWKVVAGKLHREYVFADFVAAFGFMASAALVAQAMDHHPEWANVWNKVSVDLTTHDAAGISALDVELAHVMEELARRQPAK